MLKELYIKNLAIIDELILEFESGLNIITGQTGSGKSIIMASLKIDYLEQIKHPTSMIIGQRVSRVGKTSFDIESVIFNDAATPVCHAVVIAVCFDFNNQIAVPVYPSIVKDYEK